MLNFGDLLKGKQLTGKAAPKPAPALWDVTYTEPKIVSASSLKEAALFKAFLRNTHGKTVERVFTTIDEIISAKIKEGCTKTNPLIWMNVASMIGHQAMSTTPKRANHCWDSVIAAVGDGKNCNKLIGVIVRYRIALRPEENDETWLLWRQDTDNVDPDTGRVIQRSCYWIDNDFDPNKRRS